MYTRYDKMREIEAEISKLKNEKFRELTRPCSAFIIFEEEDAYNLSQYYEPKFSLTGKQQPAKGKFLKQDLFLIPATEPTNIIWENRSLTNAERTKRTVKVVIIVCVLAIICFIIIFLIKSVPITISKAWSASNCD